MSQQRQPHTRIAIVGTGFAGLAMAIRLLQEGIRDFTVYERAADVGGVWRDNRYPGAACDVESRLYALSFAPNPHWGRRFSAQPEIQQYLRHCAESFGVMPHIRFNHDVEDAAWDEGAGVWRITTSHGTFSADILVAAPGALSEPRIPALPGRDRFRGAVFHTARWPEDAALAGRRVAVIGTGASAIQVVPAIQPEVERLTLFQRTPPWIVPRRDVALDRRLARLQARLPLVGRALRGGIYGSREFVGLAFRHPRAAALAEQMARRHLKRQVSDAALRRLLTPDYRIGCKRVLVSDDFYPALTQPNVRLVTGGAAGFAEQGVLDADGTVHEAEVVVLATGFEAAEFPFARRIAGRGGRRLSDAWSPSAVAHLGTTVAGYPNLFVLQGPNTGLGHSSVVLMSEAQVEHVINALRFMDAHSVASVEPQAEAQAAFVADVDRRMRRTVWLTGGCRSWYLDDTGRNPTLWPGSIGSFRRRVVPFNPAEYRLHPARGRAGVA